MKVRTALSIGSNRLLHGARVRRIDIDLSTFFTYQSLGRNTFPKIVPGECAKQDITGDSPHKKETLYGLRVSMITFLQNAGFSDSAIVLRTGHRKMNSLKHCTNLRSELGKNQFEAIFNTTRNAIQNLSLTVLLRFIKLQKAILSRSRNRLSLVRFFMEWIASPLRAQILQLMFLIATRFLSKKCQYAFCTSSSLPASVEQSDCESSCLVDVFRLMLHSAW